MQVETTSVNVSLTLRGSHVRESKISSAVIHKELLQLEIT